jgi:hypothetical protein
VKLQKIISFVKVFISHDKYILHPKREWVSSDDLHLRDPVENVALIDLDLPMIAIIGVVRRRGNILTCTQINKNNKSKILSNYA